MQVIYSFLNILCFALGIYIGAKIGGAGPVFTRKEDEIPKEENSAKKSIEAQLADMMNYAGGGDKWN